MFSLNDYVRVLFDLLEKESDQEKRNNIIKAWLDILKKHNRILEGHKILELVEKHYDSQQKKVFITSADESSKEAFENFFKGKNVKIDWSVNKKVLSGWKIIWDNTLIDNTLLHQLKKLSKALKNES